MSSARKVARLALGTVKGGAAIEKFTAGRGGDTIDDLPLNVRGGILVRRYFPVDAEYSILVRVLIAVNGTDSLVARAIGSDWKGWGSLACYAAAIPLSFWRPWAGAAVYVAVALAWLIPDRRIEKRLSGEPAAAAE